MELELRWPPEPGECEHDDVIDVSVAIGVSPVELAELRELLPGSANIEARPSSMGKGGAGPALAVVVIVERVIADSASLIAIGTALHHVIRKLRIKRKRTPLTEDPTTMAVSPPVEN